MGLNNKFLKGGNRHAKTKGTKNFPKVTLNTPSDNTKGRSDWCSLGCSGPEVNALLQYRYYRTRNKNQNDSACHKPGWTCARTV